MTERLEFGDFQEIPYAEQLVTQIGLNLPLDELRAALPLVALLGAVLRLGIACRSADELTHTLELVNIPEDKEVEELSSMRVESLSIRDVTSSYIPTRSAISPRAIEFGSVDSRITIYTPNREDENPVLGFELITSRDDQFILTIDGEEPLNIEFLSYKELDPYVSFTERYTTTYHEGNPQALQVSRRIALADAPILESKMVWNRIERLKGLIAEETPPQLIEVEKELLKDHIHTLSALLGTKLIEEQTDKLAQRALSNPTEEIIQEIFDEARESISPLVLGLFKAGLTAAGVSSPTEWSVAGNFRVVDEGWLILEGIEAQKVPSLVLSRWEEEAKEFTHEKTNSEFFFELRYIKEFIDADFENFTAILLTES